MIKSIANQWVFTGYKVVRAITAAKPTFVVKQVQVFRPKVQLSLLKHKTTYMEFKWVFEYRVIQQDSNCLILIFEI